MIVCKQNSRNLCCDIKCNICYEKSFAKHERSQFLSIKNKLKAHEIYYSSHQKIIIDCNICNHEFITIVKSITLENKWCPYCSHVKLCKEDNCIKCFNNSFASCNESKYFSIKNNEKPRNLFKYTIKKYLFYCDICVHEYISSIVNIYSKNEKKCPYCSHTKLCNNNCNFCFNNSFASHEKSIYWNTDNIIQPRNIFKYSSNKYKFNCDICYHIFELRPTDILNKQWCPYCASKRLCNDINCKSCYEKSFASNILSKYLYDDINPRDLFKYSNKKYNFKCEKCNNIFIMSCNSVSNKNEPRWCPFCKKKTEAKLYKWLLEQFKQYQIIYQINFNWCVSKKKYKMRYDFLITDIGLIIELDGLQHFIEVKHWNSVKYTHENDIYKMKLANDNGYSIIRIFQPDVYYDKNDWENKLTNCIKKYDEPTNIYISSIDCYKIF